MRFRIKPALSGVARGRLPSGGGRLPTFYSLLFLLLLWRSFYTPETKSAVIQWNILLDIVVTILNYKKSTIDHAIYIKVFTDGTVSYLKVPTDDVLNNTNNENSFTELTRFLKNTLR